MIVGVKFVAAEVIRTDIGIDSCGRARTGDAAIERVDINNSCEFPAPGADILRLEHPAFGKFPLQAKMSLFVVRGNDVLIHVARVRHYPGSSRE